MEVKSANFIAETDFVYMLLFPMTECKVMLPSVMQWFGECVGIQTSPCCLSLDQGFLEFPLCNSLWYRFFFTWLWYIDT